MPFLVLHQIPTSCDCKIQLSTTVFLHQLSYGCRLQGWKNRGTESENTLAKTIWQASGRTKDKITISWQFVWSSMNWTASHWESAQRLTLYIYYSNMACSHIFYFHVNHVVDLLRPPPFPLVHLFHSYLCRNQAISAPPAHKHNERENTVLQHSHCLSNRLQHHWERNRALLERRSTLYLPEKLEHACSASNYISCEPPFSFKHSVVVKKECKNRVQSLLLALRKDSGVRVRVRLRADWLPTGYAEPCWSTRLWWGVNNSYCSDTGPPVSQCLAGQLSYGGTRGK